MQDCLLELSRLNPLVLVIDDVQRADAESAGLLASLAHEAHDNSLLVIVSAASDEPTRGPPALAKLRELSHVTTLPALGEAHVAELITAIFGAVPNATRLARWLYAQSEGSPRRAMDLLRLLLQRRVVRYQGGLFSLPYDVGSEVGAIELERVPSARLEALGADAHRLAQQLSIEDDATQLEASGRAFSKPRAALLRMCHFGFRGEQEAADKERGKAEVLALLGGTSWSAMSAMAIRQLLMYQWTRDSVGLLRVLEELQNLIVIAPTLETHRALGTAYLELLRGRPQRAP